MEGYIESVFERDINLPAPSDVRNVRLSDTKSFVMPVYCNLKNYNKKTKAIKKTLTIPEWLNDRAIKYNINFSETLQNALIEKL